MTGFQRDHGGGIDAARAVFGGARIGWIDLSTGINPLPYPVSRMRDEVWSALPDQGANQALIDTAKAFWNVPKAASVLAAPGLSVLIAQIPRVSEPGQVHIPQPTYNEHAAAFAYHGWTSGEADGADAQVIVHPNNPDGKLWSDATLPLPDARLTIIDESFCDLMPENSLIHRAAEPGTVILKSFGKFWGLAGMRLGFAIGDPDVLAHLRNLLGPWPVSGPALHIGARALGDAAWASATRRRLAEDSARLDDLMQRAGAKVAGGTALFRLYQVDHAASWQERLAQKQIWSRTFPYNPHWLRLGLPHPLHWPRVTQALS